MEGDFRPLLWQTRRPVNFGVGVVSSPIGEPEVMVLAGSDQVTNPAERTDGAHKLGIKSDRRVDPEGSVGEADHQHARGDPLSYQSHPSHSSPQILGQLV